MSSDVIFCVNSKSANNLLQKQGLSSSWCFSMSARIWRTLFGRKLWYNLSIVTISGPHQSILSSSRQWLQSKLFFVLFFSLPLVQLEHSFSALSSHEWWWQVTFFPIESLTTLLSVIRLNVHCRIVVTIFGVSGAETKKVKNKKGFFWRSVQRLNAAHTVIDKSKFYANVYSCTRVEEVGVDLVFIVDIV